MKTESTITNAVTPTPTPNIEILEIREINDAFFLAKKYLLAMYKGKFKNEAGLVFCFPGFFLVLQNKAGHLNTTEYYKLKLIIQLYFLSFFQRRDIQTGNQGIHFSGILCGLVEKKFKFRDNSYLMANLIRQNTSDLF